MYMCYMSLTHGATGWSVICDPGISWSNSFVFSVNKILKRDSKEKKYKVKVTWFVALAFSFPDK